MSRHTYAARVGAEWRDFTVQHARSLEQALSIARGDHPVPAGAIVGVYGSGKSTLLLAVMARAVEEGILPVWEEASSFLDRLVTADERLAPHDFVTRTHKWIESIRTDSEVFANYQRDLQRRKLDGIASAVEAALRSPTERTVLLLDEMEQAYPSFLKRIETADQQPLRALIDSCGNSRLRLLMAYAPESFHSLGDADRGRMLRLPVPSLSATSIQQAFGLTRGQANFAWWASRGRARGVLKAVEEVIRPYLRGELDGWRDLPQALDALPPVFGVPAVLRGHLELPEIPELLDLVPRPQGLDVRSDVIDMRDGPKLAEKLLQGLFVSSAPLREESEAVVGELLDVLDAVCDSEHRCFLTFEDFSAAVKLAVARAVESGQLRESLDHLDAGRTFFTVTTQAQSPQLLPFSLSRLADDIFPSPFTDPVLPLGDGHVPGPDEVDRLFAQLVPEPWVFNWAERECLLLRDSDTLEQWLNQELARVDESVRWRVLLLDDAKAAGHLTVLAREAGRVGFGTLPRFHATFVKCLAMRARQTGVADDLESIAASVRRADRQLGRKVDWHLARIGRSVEELNPVAGRRWQGAIRAARSENFSGVIGRLAEDSPGLLAFLFPLKAHRPETRKMLAELSEILADGGELRKLAKAAGTGKRLEGAAVVVDELLPSRPGSAKQRWIETQFDGKDDLRSVLDEFASSDTAGVLGRLLHPHSAQRMERIVLFHGGDLPDLKPERQQLNAIQGINGVLQRAKLVHTGIKALLGTQEEVRGLAIGRLITQAVAARKAIDAFNRLGTRLEKIEEPWAKALALWVAAVFAERIWDGVEHDEASLKAWETLADRGADLGRKIEARIGEFREIGLRTVAEFLASERSRLKAGVSDVEQMRVRMEQLQSTLEEVSSLADVIQRLKDMAAERAMDISDLLETFRPEVGRMAEETRSLEDLLNLLGGNEDDWPPPSDEDLRKYVRRLRVFAEESRADRLRSRLSQAIGLPVIAKQIVLDPNDVTEIEEQWPDLILDFADSCRDAIERTPPSGSDQIVVWMKESLDKQTAVAAWRTANPSPRLASFDATINSWATGVMVRPTTMAEIGASRGRLSQLLKNLERSVGASVIDELTLQGGAVEPADLYATLEHEAHTLQVEVEALAQKLTEIAGAGAVQRPFPGSTRAAVVAELDAARRRNEDKREELHKRILSLGRVVEVLGGRPRPIPSPLTVPEAERLANAAHADSREQLDEAWDELWRQLRSMQLDDSLISRVPDMPSEEDLASLEFAREQWSRMVEQATALIELGIPFPTIEEQTPDGFLAAFTEAVRDGEAQLEDVIRRIQIVRLRLQRLGQPEVESKAAGTYTNLRDAQSELQRVEAQIEGARAQRLAEASKMAQGLYRALIDGPNASEQEVPSALRELRDLGLVRTVEEDS